MPPPPSIISLYCRLKKEGKGSKNPRSIQFNKDSTPRSRTPNRNLNRSLNISLYKSLNRTPRRTPKKKSTPGRSVSPNGARKPDFLSPGFSLGARSGVKTPVKGSLSDASPKRRAGFSGVARRLTPFEKSKADLAEALKTIAQLQAESQNKTDFILAQKKAAIVQNTLIEDMAAEALDQLALKTTNFNELTQELEALRNEREEQIQFLTLDLQKAAKMLSAKNETIENLESMLTAAKTDVAALENAADDSSATDTEEELFRLTEELVHADEKLVEKEMERRLMHNTIQELKGNVRVLCRVRPPAAGAKVPAHIAVTTKGGKQEIALKINEPAVSGEQKTRVVPFTFDRIFSSSATQQHVFAEISQLVQSALDGHNVTIFAYGNTGSGKTYTMQGTASDVGLIPRTIDSIFLSAGPLEAAGWEYTYEASFLEIYGEKIHDLLSDQPAVDQEHEVLSPDPSNDDTPVKGVTLMPVESPEAAASLIATAAINRERGAIMMNTASSRSHSIFRLKIVSVNPTTEDRTTATVNLVDLAGSERLESGSTKDQLKQAQLVNDSLTHLGIVVAALKHKETHVPYRDSKLTWLLGPVLSGHSKCLMLINVSSDPACAAETLRSLKYASKVDECIVDASEVTAAKGPRAECPREAALARKAEKKAAESMRVAARDAEEAALARKAERKAAESMRVAARDAEMLKQAAAAVVAAEKRAEAAAMAAENADTRAAAAESRVLDLETMITLM